MSDLPIILTCVRCRGTIVLTGEAAQQWRPGAVAQHAPGQCPAELAATETLNRTFELDLVLRVRPTADGTVGYDESVAASEVLARVTERVDAPTANWALDALLSKTAGMWEKLAQIAPVADVSTLQAEAPNPEGVAGERTGEGLGG
jgi:hypothetical protein